LATPESVSATWPMTARFDLVIFDEASQCFAEKGIPSAFRGNQLVVVGDDKQLPPNQLFTSRFEEDGAPDPSEDYLSEHNSLLDLSKQFFPQVLLKSHYRSQFPELIYFSNFHFYDQKLEVFPAPASLHRSKTQLYFHKVEGEWEAQQNVPEAEHIANHCLQFFRENQTESLGIITFNALQQSVIEEKVEALASIHGLRIPDSFFVKNIENVQGDERDHIWFSIGYGLNPKGKFIAQFGSLNQAGGENRLNVAISRAKKSIRVFSSLWPGDFQVSDTASAGPQLLKKYLQFVFENSSQNGENRRVNQALFSGSLHTLCDTFASADSNKTRLIFSRPETFYRKGTMKEYFGLRPNYLKSLGYEVGFDFPLTRIMH
jgi:superfamily I DNA and/or RNA helicase